MKSYPVSFKKMFLWLILPLSILLFSSRRTTLVNTVTNSSTGETFSTIQSAIDDAQTLAGHTIAVGPGVYNENVTVHKNNLLLESVGGSSVTTIQGTYSGGAGSVMIATGINGVSIGAAGKGFKIIGFDGTGAIEAAALYLLGAHTNISISGNEIVAAGDHGLLSNFNAAIDGISITGNTFSGKTFLGNEPGGCGFATQFAPGNNVPRQLVTIGGGAGVSNSKNVIFTGNTISGVAGGFNTTDNCEQGNFLVTIDVIGATITQNKFHGFTTSFAGSLRARGSATSISCNSFSGSLGANCVNIFLGSANPLNGATPNTLPEVASRNAFLSGAAYLTPDHANSYMIYLNFAQATAAATANGAGQSVIPVPVIDLIFPAIIEMSPNPAVPNQQLNSIFIGYGPQSLTLTARAPNNDLIVSSYLWSTGETTASINVSPTTTTGYSVILNFQSTCFPPEPAYESFLVEVIDITCGGKKAGKVIICHDGKTLCVALNQASGHLAHGDMLGSCVANSNTELNPDIRFEETNEPFVPSQFGLKNYPNPFNSSTAILFQLPANSHVLLKVFDITGKEVATLVNGDRKAGSYRVEFKNAGLKNGIYYYTFRAKMGDQFFTKTMKMIYIQN